MARFLVPVPAEPAPPSTKATPMAMVLQSTSPITSAWLEFVEGGTLNKDLLRPEVTASWLRSRKAGIDPFAECSTQTLEKKDLDALLDNSHLSSLFLTVSDGVVVTDRRGLIQQVNPVAEKIFGMDTPALVGRSLPQSRTSPNSCAP